MIIRYKVKWVTAQPLIGHVDRPALLTTRIEEGVLIAPIATKYFLDQGCILFHKNSADFVTLEHVQFCAQQLE